MVIEKKCCHRCGSDQIVKNGHNGVGNPKYKACGFGGVFQTKRPSEEFKETVIRAAQERSSSRGLARTFGISHVLGMDCTLPSNSPSSFLFRRRPRNQQLSGFLGLGAE